ncbi:MAG: formyltetrahydrofolate deformylase [Alphaproteobacteria bacterium]|nr:formyltetrahydrofolate deformylase [Alphaproteobacteria bacterium]
MHVLRLSCDDKPGIVAAVATTLSNNQCNIEESAQFHDDFSNQFFMRVVFTPLQDGCLSAFKARFAEIADEFKMDYQVCDLSCPVKTLIMVSQHDHCLHDLFYRWNKGNLPIDIQAVVSNHNVTKGFVENYSIPFQHFPVTKENKIEQEEKVQTIIDENDIELVIMARYMQILTDNFCKENTGKVINIHHSFLPGFKGARPYHQAYERGVKIIGATAHFATADLDEGPIITQDVVPVDHRDTPDTMQRLGQDTESRVLARAVKLYAERRIFMHDRRTIIL